MRPLLVLAAIAAFSASPAHAQFVADDSAQADYPDGGYAAEETADYGYDTAPADNTDPYAADPAYDAAPARGVGERTVGEIAAGLLGAKGARHAQDIGAIISEVTRKGNAPGADSSSSSSDGGDAVSLIRNVLGVARKAKKPQ